MVALLKDRVVRAGRRLARVYCWASTPVRIEAFRLLDRLLPVDVLYQIQAPLVAVPHALVRRFLAPRWGNSTWLRGFVLRRSLPPEFYINCRLEYVRDRARSARWAGRCRLVGREHLEAALRAGRPAILAFYHVGPFILTASLLRAHGLPVVPLCAGTRQGRHPPSWYIERFKPLLGLPDALYRDEVRAVVRHVANGGCLLIAVDVEDSSCVDVPLGDGRVFRTSTGAARLAARHGADLIPCGIVDEGGWRFRVELGRPVPAHLLGPTPDLVAVGAHLHAEMCHLWRDRPGQVHPELGRQLRPVATPS